MFGEFENKQRVFRIIGQLRGQLDRMFAMPGLPFRHIPTPYFFLYSFSRLTFLLSGVKSFLIRRKG